MRRSGWIYLLVATLVWCVAVCLPIIAASVEFFGAESGVEDVAIGASHFWRTSAWAVAVAVGALVVGWGPGQFLGRAATGRGFVLVGTLFIAPICLPAYVVFHAWGLAWPPGSFIFDWAVANRSAGLVRSANLYLGLVCWAWPITAWCVAAAVSAAGVRRDELMQLDGAGRGRRLMNRVREARSGLAVGGVIVFLFVFNNTMSFDFAQIRTIGYELRALDATGGTPRDVLVAAWPGVVLAVLAGGAIWWGTSGRPRDIPERTTRPGLPLRLQTAAIWVLTIGVPISLLLFSIDSWSMVERVAATHGPAAVNDLTWAVISGGVGAALVIGLGAMWMDHRSWVRGLATLQALGWLVMAAIPGTVAAVAIEAAYNTSAMRLDEWVYTQPTVVAIGHVARFGFVAALLGRWVARREAEDLRAIRELDGAQSAAGLFMAARPRWIAAGVAGLFVISVLSLSEIVVTARIQPPGYDPIAQTILDGMHYQRLESVSVMSVLLVLFAILGGLLMVGLFCLQRTNATVITVCLCGVLVTLLLGGCGEDAPRAAGPLDAIAVFGAPGQSSGRFDYPRAIDVDPIRKHVYVIDKTARVQRFGFDGKYQGGWRMPLWDNGKPVGISVHEDGRVFVADTHEHRVMVFDEEGRELMQFGEYGEGAGEFYWPTDVAFGPGGRIYVSEYGGHDRVQIFDEYGVFLSEFGVFGEGDSEFNRPQSLAFSPDRSELYVADAINHRVQVFDPEGGYLRTLGRPGKQPGQFSYPYGIMVLSDGSLLVAEFGNNRIQHLDPDGRSLGVYGESGSGPGQLYSPWGVAGNDDTIFVLDSRNNRVQVIDTP